MAVENDVPDDAQGDVPADAPEDAPKETLAVEDDNVGDISVEINVEELVAKVESSDDAEDSVEKAEIRKKLDKIRETQDDELDSTYNFDLDDDV